MEMEIMRIVDFASKFAEFQFEYLISAAYLYVAASRRVDSKDTNGTDHLMERSLLLQDDPTHI